jgi:hypothetical protein
MGNGGVRRGNLKAAHYIAVDALWDRQLSRDPFEYVHDFLLIGSAYSVNPLMDSGTNAALKQG